MRARLAAALAAACVAMAPTPALALPAMAQRLIELRDQVRMFPDTVLARLLALQPGIGAEPPRVQAELLAQISSARARLNQHDAAAATADQIVAYGRALKDDAIVVKGLLAQEAAAYARDDNPAAQRYVFEAEKLALRTGDQRLRAEAGLEAGVARAELGDFPGALATVQSAIDAARTLEGDPMPLFHALRALTRLHIQTKDRAKAYATLGELTALAEQQRLPLQMVLLKTSEYIVNVSFGRPERARRALLECLALERKLGARYMLPSTLNNVADSYLKAHDYPRAAQYAAEALRAANGLNFTGSDAAAHSNLGQAYLGMGRIAEGKRHFEASLAWFEQTQSKPDLQSLLLEYGQALEDAGDMTGAIQAYHRERAISNELFQAKRRQAVLELQEWYAADQKQRQIELLSRENRIKDVELDNRRLAQRLWWLLAIVFGLASVAGGLLYRRVRQANGQLEAKNQTLKALSTRDPLTGLYNRRHFHDTMDRLPAAPRAGAAAGALFLLDIDHFKHINDRHGHAAGDAVLKAVAETLRVTLRETDLIVRWGGEEFLAFLPAVPRGRVDEVALRILRGVSTHAVVHQGRDIAVHVSVGFVPFPLAPAGVPLAWERVLNLADMALYLAKKNGRNRAYGVPALDHVGAAALAAIERDLERAWRDGLLELTVVDGGAPAPRPPDAGDAAPSRQANTGR
ncbi:diguanylate cyclase [Duganella sp. BJB488]|nr:diguanylate cyclase [Duganella sp. BJB489]RFP28481.1 diguanylate cyclase [Duganella sp. BJB488]RFP37336.1 diguanylate cyclase [Duganella sp. BJB480]